ITAFKCLNDVLCKITSCRPAVGPDRNQPKTTEPVSRQNPPKITPKNEQPAINVLITAVSHLVPRERLTFERHFHHCVHVNRPSLLSLPCATARLKQFSQDVCVKRVPAF